MKFSIPKSCRTGWSSLLLGALLGCDEPSPEDGLGGARGDAAQTVLPGDASSDEEASSRDAGTEAQVGGDAGGALDAAAPSSDAATPVQDAAPGVDASKPAADAEVVMDAAGPRPDAAVAASWPRLEATQLGAPKRVAGGYSLAESPLWDHCGNRLLFPDVNASVIHQLGADGKISNFMLNTNHANGMAFDRDGTLLLAQMGGGRGGKVVRRHHDGMLSVLVDKDLRGDALNTVDDLAVRSDGTLYFTDPIVPHGPYLGFSFASLPLYVLKPGTGMRMLVHGHAVSGPNGVELSPDEKTLYLSSYFEERILKLQVAADGTVSRPTTFASGLATSDSFCLDAAGNVYVGVASGLTVLRPDGSRVKTIPITSADGTTNCGFGGADGKTLYVTTWTDLWKIENAPIPGLDWQINQHLPCQ
jgi:gluconolactonase